MALVFTPPTAYVRPMTGNRFAKHPGHSLWKHYRPNPAGINVWLLPGGVVTTVEPEPGAPVDRVLHGGHLHEVSEAEAALLRAAGFTVSGESEPVLGRGSAVGTASYVGTAVGARPAVVGGTSSGMATGSNVFAGTAVGKRAPKGTATGTAAYSGTAAGDNGEADPVLWVETVDDTFDGAAYVSGSQMPTSIWPSRFDTNWLVYKDGSNSVVYNNGASRIWQQATSADHRVTARYKIGSSASDFAGGVTIRHRSEDRCIGFEVFRALGESKLTLFKRYHNTASNSTQEIDLRTASWPSLVGENEVWHTISAEIVGNSIRCYFDGAHVPALDHTLTSSASGTAAAEQTEYGGQLGVGLVNYTSAGNFDWFTVEESAVEPTAANTGPRQATTLSMSMETVMDNPGTYEGYTFTTAGSPTPGRATWTAGNTPHESGTWIFRDCVFPQVFIETSIDITLDHCTFTSDLFLIPYGARTFPRLKANHCRFDIAITLQTRDASGNLLWGQRDASNLRLTHCYIHQIQDQTPGAHTEALLSLGYPIGSQWLGCSLIQDGPDNDTATAVINWNGTNTVFDTCWFGTNTPASIPYSFALYCRGDGNVVRNSFIQANSGSYVYTGADSAPLATYTNNKDRITLAPLTLP